MTKETPEQRERRLRRRFEQKIALWNKSDGRCWYCGISLDFDTFHTDHATPISRGGGNEESNLVPSCQPCNLAKHDRGIEEFRIARQRRRDGVPFFSQSQVDWLREQGFDIDFGERFTFWFETQS